MSSLYIHLPFCKQKCNYCDFVSFAGKEELIDEYVEALIKEIQNSAFPTPHSAFSTIYFGGGTPTLLEPKHFNKLFNALVTHYALRVTSTEISIEANPGTADLNKLKALRSLGINRLSIGVQSFNDKHLKTLGRIHNGAEAIKFYKDARAAGFDNINLDLMFALPGQTLDEWQSDLQTAINLKPNHLSTYNLHLEEGTPLWRSYNSPVPSPQPPIPSEDLELAMYEHTIETLTAAGYKHYEISNFAKPGCECQHNINYWQNGNYLGLGAGAHSHFNGQRWANPNCIEAYIDTRYSLPVTRYDSQKETLFMGLRLLDGISVDNFTGFEKEVKELMNDGLLVQENNNYKLTRQGLYLGNLVFEKFV